MTDVEIRTFGEVDLRGGTVVAAFPSVGMVSSITATYLISTLRMDQVCALESEDFPALSMIYANKPKFPARVYAHRGQKFAIFICEIPLPPRSHRPVARALLGWAQSHGARQIVPLEGLPVVSEDNREASIGGSGARTGPGRRSRPRGSASSRRASSRAWAASC